MNKMSEDKNKIKALMNYLNCTKEEAIEHIENYDYRVFTDSEANEAVKETIKEELWAFNASFILDMCDLPFSGKKSLQKMQEESCESANDFILALVEKTCGLDSFVESAIQADGRGHFLSPYDGEEIEEGEYFIYRQN